MNDYHWTLLFLVVITIFLIFEITNVFFSLTAIFIHFGLTIISLLQKIQTSLEKPDVS